MPDNHHVDELLPWYDSGRLDPAAQARLSAHLPTCAACRTELVRLRTLASAVQRQAPLPATHDAVWTRIDAAVRAQPHPRKGRSPVPAAPLPTITPTHHTPAAPDDGTPRRRWSPGGLVAVALLAVLIGSFFLIRKTYLPAGFGGGKPTNLGSLFQIAMVSSTEGWAVGFVDNYPLTPTPGISYNPETVLHYTGGKWQIDLSVPSPLQPGDGRRVHYAGIAMDSPADGWIVGSVTPPANADGMVQGLLLHYSQGHWTLLPGTFPALTAISMISADDGWAVGDHSILHYHGGQWRLVTNPLAPTANWSAVSAIGADAVWMATGAAMSGGSKIYQFDGQQWSQDALDLSNAVIGNIQMISADEGWAVGGHWKSGAGALVLHYQQGTWHTEFSGGGTYRGGPAYLFAVGMASANEGWAVGFGGIIVHYHNGQWQKADSPTTNGLLSISMLSASDGWAAGDSGTLLHLLHGVWQLYTP